MPAYGQIDQALAGLIDGIVNKIDSAIAQEVISFGQACFGYPGFEGKCWRGHQDQATCTMSAVFVASNSIAVTINGTLVTTVFATDSNTTLAAVISNINANVTLQGLGISAAASTTANTFLVRSKGLDLVVTVVVTLGASQPTCTPVLGEWGEFIGVATFAQKGTRTVGAGNSAYQIGDAVNMLIFGDVSVPSGDANLAYVAAYVDLSTGTNQGFWKSTATGIYLDIGARYKTARNSTSLLSKLAITRGIQP